MIPSAELWTPIKTVAMVYQIKAKVKMARRPKRSEHTGAKEQAKKSGRGESGLIRKAEHPLCPRRENTVANQARAYIGRLEQVIKLKKSAY